MDTQYTNKNVLAALKEHYLCPSLLVCLFARCSASVNALQVVLRYSSNESTAKWETCQIFNEDWLLVCVFSWNVCNQNGHFIRCIQSSSFHGYDRIRKSWDNINI